jgi:hypothetical protein
MRTLLLPLAVGSLLALVGRSCAEFDSGGTAPAKVKATQTTGAAFDGRMAATRAVQKGLVIADGATFVRLAIGVAPPRVLRCIAISVKLDVPPPVIKNPSNIPRPRR